MSYQISNYMGNRLQALRGTSSFPNILEPELSDEHFLRYLQLSGFEVTLMIEMSVSDSASDDIGCKMMQLYLIESLLNSKSLKFCISNNAVPSN